MDQGTSGSLIALTAAGVSILVDATAGRLPAVVYWGPALPGLDAEQAARAGGGRRAGDRHERPGRAAAGRAAARAPHRLDRAARPARLVRGRRLVARLPGHRRDRRRRTRRLRSTRGGAGRRRGPAPWTTPSGWSCGWPWSCCRPGCCGPARRCATSPRSRTRSTIWCWRSRCRPRRPSCSTSPAGTTRSGCRCAAPFPAGTHLRENRKGRTGADSAYLLHAGTAGFGFAAGRLWAVHTAWSGNHTHYAEQVHTGERLLGGGELLLPGEIRLATGRELREPVAVRRATATASTTVARRFHRHLRARRPQVGRPAPGDPQRLGGRLLRPRHRPAASTWPSARPPPGSSGTCWTTAGSAPAATTRSGLGDWVVSAEVWPRRPAPAGRPGAGAGHAVRALVRAGDGQPGLRRGPRPPRVDHGGADRVADRVAHPAGAQPGHPGGVRARQGADPGRARRVRRSATSSGTTTGT